MNYAIILAAGKGTRMNKQDAKCASLILGKPMIDYIVDELEKTDIQTTIPVIGYKKETLEEILKIRKNIEFAIQEEQLGTGHAVKIAKERIKDLTGVTLIICGDMPLINADVINHLLAYHETSNNDITLATTTLNDPSGYGRIIRNYVSNELLMIIEENDASYDQKKVKEINTGLYCVKTSILFDLLDKIKNNNSKKEYYLTDLIKIANGENLIVKALQYKDSNLFTGINDLYNLSKVEDYIRESILKNHMLNGVKIINPQSVLIESNVIIKPNTTIFPNTVLTKNTVIEEGCNIGPNTQIINSIIKENTSINSSVVTNSTVGSNTTVGPFAHIRLNTVIEDNVRVGNFVEIKESVISNNTKMAHLAYVGDADIKTNTNIGCGVVIANYDGRIKHKTTIGNNVFIGSNSTLIAPINIKDNVLVAAGSTVTSDLQEGDFVVARSKEVIKPNYASKYIKK